LRTNTSNENGGVHFSSLIFALIFGTVAMLVVCWHHTAQSDSEKTSIHIQSWGWTELVSAPVPIEGTNHIKNSLMLAACYEPGSFRTHGKFAKKITALVVPASIPAAESPDALTGVRWAPGDQVFIESFCAWIPETWVGEPMPSLTMTVTRWKHGDSKQLEASQ